MRFPSCGQDGCETLNQSSWELKPIWVFIRKFSNPSSLGDSVEFLNSSSLGDAFEFFNSSSLGGSVEFFNSSSLGETHSGFSIMSIWAISFQKCAFTVLLNTPIGFSRVLSETWFGQPPQLTFDCFSIDAHPLMLQCFSIDALNWCRMFVLVGA